MNKKELALKKLQEMKRLAEKRNALLQEKKLRDNPAMGIALLLEGDLEQAEIALAVQSMEDDIQSMAEKVAKMKVEELMPLTDRVREQFGTDKAEAFDAAVEETLDGLLTSLKATREALSIQSLVIQGKADAAEMSDMAGDDFDDTEGGDLDLGGDDLDLGDEGGDDEIDDLFGGSDEASGPSEEPLGRARKESAKNKKPVLETKKKDIEKAEIVAVLKELANAENDLECEIIADRHGFLLEEIKDMLEDVAERVKAKQLLKINTPGSAMREALGLNDPLTEGESLKDLRAEKAKIDDEIERIVQDGGRVSRTDPLSKKLGTVTAKISKAKKNEAIEEGALGDLALTAAKWIPSPIAPIARAADMLGAFDDEETDDEAPKTGEEAAQAAEDEKVKNMPVVKQAMKKVTNKVAQNPAIKKVADTLGVDAASAAELVTDSVEYNVSILEHSIVEMTEDSEMRESEAVTLLKAKMSTARAGKSIAETEAFDGGMTLSTPRSLLKQLTKKYGSPENWQIAENDEGGYYVISERIPETLRAKELEEQLATLDADAANLREEYGDLEEDYKLPQEIRAGKLRDQLKEFVQGYHHPVARWCTMDEARSIVALGRRWFGKNS